MNYQKLYTIERFRPARPALRPANDRDALRLVRPNDDGARAVVGEEEPGAIHRFVHLKADRKALRHTIDGIVQRGRIYTLTGPTNAGKTAFCTMAALAVATGRHNILNLGVERGRVIYLAIENPDDTVSRFEIAQHFHRLSNFQLRDLFIVTVKATPERVLAELERLSRSGGFALVIVDTLAAYFDGTDMNDNVAVGNFMRRLRALSMVLGNPAVLVPAHPTKGADRGSLIPYGGGAIVNEVDGNLTLWRAQNFAALHHQTKLRGPNFAPVMFRFQEYGCDEVSDAKGRRVVMPLLVPVAAEAAAQLALPDRTRDRQQSARPDAKLLQVMVANPKGTQQDWATATGVAKSNVNRRLMRLKGEGLVRSAGGRWTVTLTGRRLARPTQMKNASKFSMHSKKAG
jgi:archaellum biogenesis ATPase FlaH